MNLDAIPYQAMTLGENQNLIQWIVAKLSIVLGYGPQPQVSTPNA